MTLLSLLEGVDPRQVVAVLLVALLMAAVLVLVFGARNRSDNRAAAQAPRPQHLPRNFDGGWDRLDEYRRPW